MRIFKENKNKHLFLMATPENYRNVTLDSFIILRGQLEKI